MAQAAREIYSGRYCDKLFQRVKPTISVKFESGSSGTGWKDHFATVEYEDIHPWVEFSEETIDFLFEEELRKPLGNWTNAHEMEFLKNVDKYREYEIVSEEDINEMFRGCLQSPLQSSVNFNGNNIRDRIHQCKMEEYELERDETLDGPEKTTEDENKEFELKFEDTPIRPDQLAGLDAKRPYKKGPD